MRRLIFSEKKKKKKKEKKKNSINFIMPSTTNLSVSSSSWRLGWAAVCDCGIPWTFLLPFLRPGLVPRSDAHPTGDQEIAGSIVAGSGTILSWRLIMKYFTTVILSLLLIQEGQLSVSRERMFTSTGKPHRRLSISKKSVIR